MRKILILFYICDIIIYMTQLRSHETEITPAITKLPLSDVGHSLVVAALINAKNKRISELVEQNEQLIEQKKQHQHDSYHDPLTGVLNRRGLDAKLEEMARLAGKPEALLMVDLTNFKAINDHFGYEAGDQAIRDMTTLLQSVIRQKDTLARIGGDEFVIILGDENAERETESSEGSRELDGIDPAVKIDYAKLRIAGEIRDFLCTHQQLHNIGFDLAVGGVVWRAGDDYETLTKRAEHDMKIAKEIQHRSNGKHR